MYVDSNGKEYKNIHFLSDKVEDFDVGWYFADETYNLVGPYASPHEAIHQFDEYFKMLNTKRKS